jgi:hypothetical protein
MFIADPIRRVRHDVTTDGIKGSRCADNVVVVIALPKIRSRPGTDFVYQTRNSGFVRPDDRTQ